MKNSAILIVYIQFLKLDQASLAPKEAYRAINIICTIDAKEARDKIKPLK
jgi:hypothetical protein